MTISGWIDRQFLDQSRSFGGGAHNGPCPVMLMLKDTFKGAEVFHGGWYEFSVGPQKFTLNTVAAEYIRSLHSKGIKPKNVDPFWVRLTSID